MKVHVQEDILEKLTTASLYLFVFLLPWQTVYVVREVFLDGEKWQYGTIGIYASDIVLIVLLGLVVYRRRKDCYRSLWQQSSLRTTVTAIFVVYLLLSSLWAGDMMLALYAGVKVAAGFAFIYSVRYVQYNVVHVIWFFIASLVMQSGLGLWQFFTQTTFASTLLGTAFHDTSVGGTSVIDNTGRWLRAYGGQTHPNTFGALMAIGIVLSMGFTVSHNRLRRVFFTLSFVMFTVGLFVSFSRSAFIAALFGIMAVMFVIWLYKRYAFVFALMFLVLFLSVGSLLYVQYGSLYETRIVHTTRLEQKSLTERVNQIHESLFLIVQSPLVGVGAGNYTYALRAYDQYVRPVWQYQPVHNIELLIFAELGIIGVALVIAVFVFFFKNVIVQLHQQNYVFWIFTIGVAVFFISALFDHWQWGSHGGILTLAFLGAMLYTARTEKS